MTTEQLRLAGEPSERLSDAEIVQAIIGCTRHWTPDARLLGNLRAGDIARALEALAAQPSEVAPVPGTLLWKCGRGHLWHAKEAKPCSACASYREIERLTHELTETRRARIGDSEIIGREMCRAEKAEADLADVARQRDAYRERSRCLRERLRNSEQLRLASPSAPSGWQPIWSAPKDGTWVLLHTRVNGRDLIASGQWTRDGGGELCWFWTWAAAPTSWMPLPPAPTQEPTS